MIVLFGMQIEYSGCNAATYIKPLINAFIGNGKIMICMNKE